MKNGPGQACGQRSPVCMAPLIGAGRNARSRAMTGIFGPGPRLRAMRSPGQHISIKIRCRFRKCGQGGRRGWFRGERRPLAGAQGALLPPEPHPPSNALFQMDGQVVCAADCAPLMVPRHYGRGPYREKCGVKLGGVPCRGEERRGKEVRKRGGWSAVCCCRGAGHQRGRGGRSAVRQAPCAGPWKAGEDMRRRGVLSPETTGGGPGACPS